MKRMMVWLVLLGLCAAAAGSVRAQSSELGDTLIQIFQIFERFDEKILMVAKEVGQLKGDKEVLRQNQIEVRDYVFVLEQRVRALESKVAELEAAQ